MISGTRQFLQIKSLEWIVRGKSFGPVVYAGAFGVTRFYSISGKEGDWTLSYPGADCMIHVDGFSTQHSAREAAQADYVARASDAIATDANHVSSSHLGMPPPPGNQIRTAECDGKDAVPVTGQLPVGTASPAPSSHVSGIDWNNPEDPVVKLFVGYDVEGYVEHYEFVSNDGEYSPNEQEKTLIDDAISGVICELHEQLQKIVPSTPSPQTHVKALEQQIEAAREFVKRHPALTLIDLAEFEAFLMVPAAMEAALATEGKGNA